MILGLNLSFAVKRWLEPDVLASMVSDRFGVKNVQFTFDLLDPWWPEFIRDGLAKRYKEAFAEKGVSIDSVFGGLASYTYPQFLSPFAEGREAALIFFKRAVDMTLALGSKVMGTPVGGMSNRDANDPVRRSELYAEMLGLLKQLASYGKEKSLEQIHIEATPLVTEFPHSPQASVKLMEDLKDADIEFKLLIDWGHALYKPLLGPEADIDLWFSKCGPYVGSIHLQQTDGLLDRHWDFTVEGILTPKMIKDATEKASLGDVGSYLEVVPAFESPDDEVGERIKKSLDILRQGFDA
ncbi:MAG: sugar phosphate isomerase/epimerase [Deltaproteobacteria bacterium]|jgi:sugar phosphate isomerase/epimerase|nr:sugar phosphate isomerase/epimerase [Deltaproteobacteria bacterium]